MPDDTAAELAEYVRTRRLRAGLTQEALAERAGLTVDTVGALERGLRRRLYPHTARALADALGLSETERAELTALAHGPLPARGTRSREVPARAAPDKVPSTSDAPSRPAPAAAVLEAAGPPHNLPSPLTRLI